MEREKLGSRLGFILLSAGCAIGIGNVWRFPYVTGKYGGGVFVLFYIFFLIVMGLPIMTMEFAVGRASGKSVIKSFHELEKPGQKWHIHGYAGLAGNYCLMMFYTTVAGWMLYYFYLMLTGRFAEKNAEGVGQIFTDMLSAPHIMMGMMLLVVAVGFGICSVGLRKGVERITKVMMVALLGIMLLLAVHSMLMEGGADGLRFYLLPDFGRTAEDYCGRHESGVLYAEPRNRIHGYFRKLYREGTYAAEGIGKYCHTGYFCGYCGRADYFSCMLCVRHQSGQRAFFNIHYIAQCV